MSSSARRILVPVGLAALLAGGLYLVVPKLAEKGVLDPALEPYPVPKDPEILRLEEKWGLKKYSQNDEELFILEFFAGRREGVFVDVGAYDYKDKSNTYRLESEFDWGGLAIDALEEVRSGYEEHRPRSKFFTFFISDTSSDLTEFYVVQGRKNQSTGVKEHADSKKRKINTVKVPQITLDDLLDREGLGKIDFLNMDIERAEPAALRGFDIDRFRPELICIEAHPPIVGFLRKYFSEHGYERIELWSDLDPLNSYYKPSAPES